jgi:hypothetical protein
MSYVPEGPKKAWNVKLGQAEIYFFFLEYDTLFKPQECFYLERENVSWADDVCLGKIADKLFPQGGFDSNLTVV